jgi:Pentapeptide repeats (8 copies)
MNIVNRSTGAVIFSLELPQEIQNLSTPKQKGWLVLEALKRGSNLSNADLSFADLRGSTLSFANLSKADLSNADLRGSTLSFANLSNANLSNANLSKADLSFADLRGSTLSFANLSNANLSNANLRGSTLRGCILSCCILIGADFRGADLSSADLSEVKSDIYRILIYAVAEAPALLGALKTGRVTGTAYQGNCACLVGTIANSRGADYRIMPGIKPHSSRPAERFFLAIAAGDTPETNQASAIAAAWVEEFIALTKSKNAPAAKEQL